MFGTVSIQISRPGSILIDFFLFFFLLSVCYQGLCVFLSYMFTQEKPKPKRASIKFSQVKPLREVDLKTLESIETFLAQSSVEEHDVFICSCASGPEDWLARWPQVTWLQLHSDQRQNGKAATLALAQERWVGDVFVISDADMTCSAHYLSAVLGEFNEPNVGVVTALYRGTLDPDFTLGQLLESLFILDFACSVLAMNNWEGLNFAMGSTMAIRRDTLREIGGFEALQEYLADDFQLGSKATSAGWRVALSSSILGTNLGCLSLAQALSHQHRWMVTFRVTKPGAHFAFLFVQGLLWALLIGFLNLHLGMKLVFAWCVWRVVSGFFQSRNLAVPGCEHRVEEYVFLPLKDVVYLGLWFIALFGQEVSWGGQKVRFDKAGRIKIL